MLRHIAWFTEAPVAPLPEGGLTSTDASTCRRCLIPARELEELGVECSVFGNLHDADPNHVSTHLQKLHTDVVIIGKISGPSLLKLARAAKHLGCYLIADAGHGADIPPDFFKLIELADQIVAATPATATLLKEHGNHTVMVIPDCDEKSTGGSSPDIVARMWLDCVQKLKLKPPACANSNSPT